MRFLYINFYTSIFIHIWCIQIYTSNCTRLWYVDVLRTFFEWPGFLSVSEARSQRFATFDSSRLRHLGSSTPKVFDKKYSKVWAFANFDLLVSSEVERTASGASCQKQYIYQDFYQEMRMLQCYVFDLLGYHADWKLLALDVSSLWRAASRNSSF